MDCESADTPIADPNFFPDSYEKIASSDDGNKVTGGFFLAFYLRRYDERSSDYQSCYYYCWDFFGTFTFSRRLLN